MFKVIKAFHDLEDFTQTKGGHVYHKYEVGDKYPREGKNVSDARVAELAGSENAQGEPLIEEIYNGTALDLTRMKKAQLIQYADDHGIAIDPKAKAADILETIMTAPAEPVDSAEAEPEGGEEDAE